MIKEFKFSFVFFLMISLLIVFPLEISMIFAQEYPGASNEPGGRANPDIRVVDNSGKIGATNENIANTCGIIPPTTAKSSLIMSIITLCLPGVLEKLMEWKEIKCEMAVCSYEAVKNNLDPAFCKKQASYKTCKYVMGEIFAIPPLSVIDYLRDLMAKIIANPVGILFGAAASYARFQITTQCAVPNSPTCNVGVNPLLDVEVGLLIFVDTLSVYQTIVDMMENGLKGIFNFGGDSKCGELSKIKDELAGLVENE